MIQEGAAGTGWTLSGHVNKDIGLHNNAKVKTKNLPSRAKIKDQS